MITNIYTRKDILEMPAGRELDALVAQDIFGYVVVVGLLAFEQPCLISSERAFLTDSRRGNYSLCDVPYSALRGGTYPHYSTDISDAWEIAEFLRSSRVYPIEIRGGEWHEGGAWATHVYDPTGKEIVYSTTVKTVGPHREPPSICLALCRIGLLVANNIGVDKSG